MKTPQNESFWPLDQQITRLGSHAGKRRILVTARQANAVFTGVSIHRAHDQKSPWPGHLTVEEERMLRLFRQSDAKASEALFMGAELQARP